MILTDREIQIAIARRLITIDPAPADVAYSSTSLDLTLGQPLTLFKKAEVAQAKRIDPTQKEYDFDEVLADLAEDHEISEQGFELRQSELALGWTAEYVNLPIDVRLAARVEGKSSLARAGLGIHITAPTIHAGFDGQIRLELFNHGPVPIVLKPGMRICQLIFEMTFGTPGRAYQGQFSGQMAR